MHYKCIIASYFYGFEEEEVEHYEYGDRQGQRFGAG